MTIKETVLFTKKKKSDWWRASSVTKQQSQSKDRLDPRQSTGPRQNGGPAPRTPQGKRLEPKRETQPVQLRREALPLAGRR